MRSITRMCPSEIIRQEIMREFLVNGNGQPEDKATPLVVIVII